MNPRRALVPISVVLAVGMLSVGCRPGARIFGFPIHAARKTPPSGIEHSAVAVGAAAPPLMLASTAGDTWSSKRALDAGPAVLVFYRGDW